MKHPIRVCVYRCTVYMYTYMKNGKKILNANDDEINNLKDDIYCEPHFYICVYEYILMKLDKFLLAKEKKMKFFWFVTSERVNEFQTLYINHLLLCEFQHLCNSDKIAKKISNHTIQHICPINKRKCR